MNPRDLPVLAPAPSLSLQASYIPQEYVHAGLSGSQLGSILWAYRKQTLLIAATVVFAAAVACKFWPRTYESTATLMVNFEVNDPLGGREFPVGLLGSYMSTQVELVRSSEVLLPVVDSLNLASNRDYIAGYRRGGAASLREWAEAVLRKNLLVEQGRFGSQLINVRVAARSPREAAQIANAIAQVYADQQYLRLTTPASERAERYTEQVADLKKKVALAQEQVVEFRQRTGAAADRSAGNQALGPAMVHALKSQLATQHASMADLRATMGPRHPQVRALQSQIDANTASLNAELRSYSSNAGAELTSSLYQLELDSAQSVYKRALDGYDQIMFASLGGYTNVSFVSRATPPARYSKPKVPILMFLACVAGLGLGIAVPLAYELLHRRVRCRDDVERDHGIPVLMELGPIGRNNLSGARGLA